MDSGCSKSLILKKFTDKKSRSELDEKDRTVYRTHTGKFVSNSAASVAMRMVEFEENSNITIEHKFQVDEITNPKKCQYDMIIGSDLMWNMGLDISYRRERVEWLDDYIPLKELDTLKDRQVCEMLYSVHTDAPILKEMEERQNRILDADYSKVDIPSMVAELQISDESKRKLKTTLEKFPELFGGGLGCLKGIKPASIKLTDGAEPYKGRHYNTPKAYHRAAKEGNSINDRYWRPRANEFQSR